MKKQKKIPLWEIVWGAIPSKENKREDNMDKVRNVKKEEGEVIFGGAFLLLGTCFIHFQQQTEQSGRLEWAQDEWHKSGRVFCRSLRSSLTLSYQLVANCVCLHFVSERVMYSVI